jgi:hypothetical protein
MKHHVKFPSLVRALSDNFTVLYAYAFGAGIRSITRAFF